MSVAPLHDDVPRLDAKQVRKHVGGVDCNRARSELLTIAGTRTASVAVSRAAAGEGGTHLGSDERGGRAEGGKGEDGGAHSDPGSDEWSGWEEGEEGKRARAQGGPFSLAETACGGTREIASCGPLQGQTRPNARLVALSIALSLRRERRCPGPVTSPPRLEPSSTVQHAQRLSRRTRSPHRERMHSERWWRVPSRFAPTAPTRSTLDLPKWDARALGLASSRLSSSTRTALGCVPATGFREARK